MRTWIAMAAVFMLFGSDPSAALPIPGGGAVETDCHAEFATTTQRLNFPAFDPANPAPREELRCLDGDAGCDLDGAANGVCVFDVDVCLRNDDEELPSCTPDDVTAVAVTINGGSEDTSLQEAIDSILPASQTSCTSGQTLAVAVADEVGQATVGIEATTAGGVTDSDTLRLGCLPHGWPSHGYNWRNQRSTPLETTIRPDNAGALTVKWHVRLDEVQQGPGTMTSTPVFGNGLLYVTTWSGKLSAIDPADGRIVWTHDSGSVFFGLEGSATLTADGRVLVAADREVQCLNAFDGSFLWSTVVSDSSISEMWTSATVANNRVFIGIAAITDDPGPDDPQIAALDLDTGEILWRYRTVPEMVCTTDTGTECATNEDCPAGGECVVGRGAGITAAPAVDRSGEIVYVNTVGSQTFPSIGDSDAIFALDAATGELLWKNRVQPPEQFGFCTNDSSIECGTDDDCDAGGCQTKVRYHDFGFLNGPMVIDVEDDQGLQTLIASGSKDGTLYALDSETGEIAWTHEVVPAPVSPGFGGWGVFNGAVGFADGKIYAALHSLAARTPPFDRLQAFDVISGALVWSDRFNRSWGDVTIANEVLFSGDCGNNIICGGSGVCAAGEDCPGGRYYVYNATTGQHIKTFETRAPVTGGAAIVDGVVYMPYGLFGPMGGVVAYEVACPGDCDLSGDTDVSELVRGADVALGGDGLGCDVFDRDGDGEVTVAELVLGVRVSLEGCDAVGK